MPNIITEPEAYEKASDGRALKASSYDWAGLGYEGFMGFAVKFNEEGKGWDYCEDCICDDDCNEPEENPVICFNLGATPVKFTATPADGESVIELEEDPTARSRQFERANNPNFQRATEEEILEGTIRPLNIRNITQVITNGQGDFIDTDYLNSGFQQGLQLMPQAWVKDEDGNQVYKYNFLVGDYNLPTFDNTYNCLKYPSQVKAEYWETEEVTYTDDNGATQTFNRLLGKKEIEIGLLNINDFDNSNFTYEKDSKESLVEVFEKAVAGKYAIYIKIYDVENEIALDWSSNRAKNLFVDSSNILLTDTPLKENLSASDTWTITDNKIEANLKYFRLKNDGIGNNFYTNYGNSQAYGLPNFAENYELAGQYDIKINLDQKDVFSVLDRRFYISLIYSITDSEDCLPEIRVEGLDNIDGFTDQKKYKATEDDLNTYDFNLSDLSFMQQHYEAIDIQLSNNNEPLDKIRVYNIELVANLNWLRKLEKEETLKIYAKKGVNCPNVFRVMVSNREILNSANYQNALDSLEGSQNGDIYPAEIHEVYADASLVMPFNTRQVAEIVFDKDELSLNPINDL